MHIGVIHLCCILLYFKLCLDYVFSICVDHQVFVSTMACIIIDIVIDIPSCPRVIHGCILVCCVIILYQGHTSSQVSCYYDLRSGWIMPHPRVVEAVVSVMSGTGGRGVTLLRKVVYSLV